MAEGRRRSQISEKAQNQRLISDWQPKLGLHMILWLILDIVSNVTTVTDGKGFTSVIRSATFLPSGFVMQISLLGHVLNSVCFGRLALK